MGHDPRFGADIRGQPIQPQTIGRNSRDEFVYRVREIQGEEENKTGVSSRLAELREQIRALLNWARSERGLTPIEVDTLRKRLEGYTQSEIAQLQGVNRQAVFSRFDGRRAPGGKRWGGIFNKAPELVQYCERADRFREAHGTIVHIELEEGDVER